MNTEQEQRADAPEPVTMKPKAAGRWLAFLGLIVALAALGASGWTWLSNRHQLGQMAQQLSQRLAETRSATQSAEQAATRAQETTREMTARIAALGEKVAASQNQQLALQTLYDRLNRNRGQWILAEVEQILLTANEQLTLAGNVKSALIALQTADKRLQHANQPQFIPLRKAIAEDIQRLQAVAPVDVAGISLKLDAVARAVGTLPLAIHENQRPDGGPAEKATDQGRWWQRLLREAWRDLRQLVRIRDMGKAQVPLLSPRQSGALRENLELRLLSARIALLQHDKAAFHGDVTIAAQWIRRYFDTSAPATQSALATLHALDATPVAVTLPDISASLNAVRHFVLAPERAAP